MSTREIIKSLPKKPLYFRRRCCCFSLSLFFLYINFSLKPIGRTGGASSVSLAFVYRISALSKPQAIHQNQKKTLKIVCITEVKEEKVIQLRVVS